MTGSRQNDCANKGQTKAKYGHAHTAYTQPNRCQHHLLRYRLAQPRNWPNDQPAAPARVDKEEGVKRGERGEQVAGRMWGEGGKSPPWTNKDTPQCYPITSHHAQCASLDVHVAFVRCEGFQTRGFPVTNPSGGKGHLARDCKRKNGSWREKNKGNKYRDQEKWKGKAKCKE